MNQENMSQVKKKGAGKNVIIILLVLVVLGLSGYLVYEKVFMKEENVKTSKIGQDASSLKGKNEKKEECDEALEVTSELVQSLYSTLITHPNHSPKNYFKNVKVEVKDIPRESVAVSAISKLVDEGTIKAGVASSFSSAQLDSVIDKIFGKNYSFSHGSFDSCPVTTYDASTKTYSVQSSGCGNTAGPGDEIKIVKAVKNNKRLEMYLRVVFLGNDGVYYKDFNKTQKVDVYTSGNEDFGQVMLQMDSNYAKGTLYKMVFTLEDGNYVFTSSEPMQG